MIEYTTKYDVRKTMYQKFAESVAKRGDKPCFYYYNNTLTWNQVADLVDACAAGMLANGVRKGDRVIICAPNMPQCIAAIYAVNKIGCRGLHAAPAVCGQRGQVCGRSGRCQVCFLL